MSAERDDGARDFNWSVVLAVGVFVAIAIAVLTRLGVNEWLACFLAGLLCAAAISVGATLRERRRVPPDT